MERSDAKVLRELDAIVAKENPCNIHTEKHGFVVCRGGTPCCGGCKFLKKSACSVTSPACKFYFCNPAYDSLSVEAKKRIEALGAKYKGELRFRFDGPVLNKPPFVYGGVMTI